MKHVFAILTVLISLFSIGQEEIWIRPNEGQWHDNIEFKINVPGGFMYLENGGFTYDFNNNSEHYQHGHEGHSDEPHESFGHVVKTHFLNANPHPIIETSLPSPFYENYFLGNDTTKWVSGIHAFNQVIFHELYSGIALKIYESNQTLKYDLIIAPGANPNDFQVKYEGQNSIEILNEELIVTTNLGTITEKKPIAYQFINGKKILVNCKFHLVGSQLSFEFPDGYDDNYELIIDPELAFSTFTGSSSDNWGMTACPDLNKNLVAGGVVFGSTYPTSSGPYDASFNGGHTDVVITKFNAAGSGIVFSTFLGGSGAETPTSLIVNHLNELYILGSTASSDFPMAGSPFDNSHAGGSSISVDGINFSGGADIYIAKLNPSGTSLLASTYFGGSSTDGISNASDNIAFNYGDQLRGEIMVDDASNVYIASTTQSSNIPIVGGFDNSLSGTQDAIVAKFNNNLSSLLWSTYVGGSGLESGNSVQLSTTGDIFVAGGTTSTNFPNTGGHLNGAFQGGTTDGYIIKFPAPSYGTPVATYIGTGAYDQAYFVQLDIDDFVYVYGQTKGVYPVSSGHYANPNSGQFIHKISNDLNASIWSSTFGAGSGSEELSPTAFLVSDCYEIYVAGWGGLTNVNNSTPVTTSTTNGFPVTADAFQPSTNGSNFYLALFTKDMIDLKYATFMGSMTTNTFGTDHVDGGTSRFDKQGGVYHAVCAACGGNDNGFPTTPGAFSETNNSSNCNMAAFLFELAKIEATLSTGSPVICIPDPVFFSNDSENGNSYFWDFGDGETSTVFEPTHFYDTPGDYTVMLVVSDSSGCYAPDTAYVDVTIQLLEAEAGTMSDTICPGTSVQLFAVGGDTYSWGPPEVLDNPASANPIATIWEETTFTVNVQSVCGSSQLTVTVHVFGANAAASPDTAICVGGSAQLWAGGGGSYSWSPTNSLNDPLIGNPVASPSITTNYIVEITTPEGCLIYDTTRVWVDQDLPFPNLVNEVNICQGESIQIIAGGATSYSWSPNYNISATNIYNPFVWPNQDTLYHVSFTNACGTTYDSVRVNVIQVDGSINPDTIICPEGSATLWASGGVSYWWTPNSYLSDRDNFTTQASPHQNTTYYCLITDQYGCQQTLSTTVSLFQSPTIYVSPEVYAVVGDTVNIWANGDGTISWGPQNWISCIDCPSTFVWPSTNYVYTATLTDENGCTAMGSVPIYFEPLIFIPNAFTPNGDSFNNSFKAEGYNIISFEMYIFNRWGELIYTINDIDQSWDGTYNGVLVLDDVYVWVVKYVDLNQDPHELRGHVTVLK